MVATCSRSPGFHFHSISLYSTKVNHSCQKAWIHSSMWPLLVLNCCLRQIVWIITCIYVSLLAGPQTQGSNIHSVHRWQNQGWGGKRLCRIVAPFKLLGMVTIVCFRSEWSLKYFQSTNYRNCSCPGLKFIYKMPTSSVQTHTRLTIVIEMPRDDLTRIVANSCITPTM